jgi:hypothetical protein
LTLKYDELLSDLAFNFNLHRYTLVTPNDALQHLLERPEDVLRYLLDADTCGSPDGCDSDGRAWLA